MRGTIRKLFGVSVSLACFALVSLYVGATRAESAAPSAQDDNPLARQFVGDPGDGWTLFGGFLLLVALALTFAAVMLWARERRGA
jgi:hypothetical protein